MLLKKKTNFAEIYFIIIIIIYLIFFILYFFTIFVFSELRTLSSIIKNILLHSF